VVDIEMMPLTASPAMATVIMEAENLSRMMVSFCLQRSGNLHSAGNEIPYEIETAWMVPFFGISR
jgi:hypothetical protein